MGRLARECGVRLAVRGEAEIGAGELDGERVVLVRPLTFMNRSGAAVAPLVARGKAFPGEMIVVHDDLDIVMGRVRLKSGGGTGGHRGLRSLVEALGSGEFLRVRVGIGRPPDGLDAADYVLAPIAPAAREAFEGAVAGAASAVRDILARGYAAAATRWNARSAAPPADRGGE